MKKPIEYAELIRSYADTIGVIKLAQTEAWNEATRLAEKSATAYIVQETVNGGKVAKVNQESILKNLKNEKRNII